MALRALGPGVSCIFQAEYSAFHRPQGRANSKSVGNFSAVTRGLFFWRQIRRLIQLKHFHAIYHSAPSTIFAATAPFNLVIYSKFKYYEKYLTQKYLNIK